MKPVMKPPPRDRLGTRDANATEITGTLLVAPALWAAIGYGLDRWLGTHFLIMVGLIIGAVAGVYLVYVKWGRAVSGE